MMGSLKEPKSTAWLALFACQVQPQTETSRRRSAATANERRMDVLLKEEGGRIPKPSAGVNYTHR
jgi:hypothetical protein